MEVSHLCPARMFLNPSVVSILRLLSPLPRNFLPARPHLSSFRCVSTLLLLDPPPISNQHHFTEDIGDNYRPLSVSTHSSLPSFARQSLYCTIRLLRRRGCVLHGKKTLPPRFSFPAQRVRRRSIVLPQIITWSGWDFCRRPCLPSCSKSWSSGQERLVWLRTEGACVGGSCLAPA